MCLYPKLLKNKKYTATKKNKGIIPALTDRRIEYVAVGCGKCMECMKKKKREWQVRLNEEIRHDKTGKFVTLTFDKYALEYLHTKLDGIPDDYDTLQNELATKGTRMFLERWRKKYKKSVKHWLITERGGNNTERIHIHGLLFTDVPRETIEKLWKWGNIFIGDYVNEKTINYIIKYCNKQDEKHKGFTPKILTSSGIGKSYLNRIDSKKNKYNGKLTEELYRTRTGTKLSLPIYYRNKLYTEEEREELWKNLLDKEERWVMGEKIDISEGEEEYFKTLKHYRKLNKQLGYGDDNRDWSKEWYKKRINWLKHVNKKNNYK